MPVNATAWQCPLPPKGIVETPIAMLQGAFEPSPRGAFEPSPEGVYPITLGG